MEAALHLFGRLTALLLFQESCVAKDAAQFRGADDSHVGWRDVHDERSSRS